jgi:hypothetical protein
MGNLKEGNHFENLGVDGKIIVKCIFKKQDAAWTEIPLTQSRNNGRNF